MFLRPAVTHKHFKHEKQQGDAHEVHELLVKFLKDDGTVFLVLHLTYVVYDRIESELAVSGTHINTVASLRNLLKHILIKLRHHDIAVPVLEFQNDRVEIRLLLGPENRSTYRKPYPDGPAACIASTDG